MRELTAAGSPPAAAGVRTHPSPFSVQETLDRFEAVIHQRQLTLFAHIDHSGEAARVGLTMPAAHVLIFGNPRGGTPLMLASPLLALDLPLKVLIWQSAEQRVWVSANSVAYLSERYTLPAELVDNLAALDAVIAEALRT